MEALASGRTAAPDLPPPPDTSHTLDIPAGDAAATGFDGGDTPHASPPALHSDTQALAEQGAETLLAMGQETTPQQHRLAEATAAAPAAPLANSLAPASSKEAVQRLTFATTSLLRSAQYGLTRDLGPVGKEEVARARAEGLEAFSKTLHEVASNPELRTALERQASDYFSRDGVNQRQLKAQVEEVARALRSGAADDPARAANLATALDGIRRHPAAMALLAVKLGESPRSADTAVKHLAQSSGLDYNGGKAWNWATARDAASGMVGNAAGVMGVGRRIFGGGRPSAPQPAPAPTPPRTPEPTGPAPAPAPGAKPPAAEKPPVAAEPLPPRPAAPPATGKTPEPAAPPPAPNGRAEAPGPTRPAERAEPQPAQPSRVKPDFIPSRTPPSGTVGGTPVGKPEPIPANARTDLKKSLRSEQKAADDVANAGYRCERHPVLSPQERAEHGLRSKANPDLRVEGKPFDVKAGYTAKSSEDLIRDSVGKKQSRRFVISTDRFANPEAGARELAERLRRHPIEGLQEVKVVVHGKVRNIYP
jgi:hypothetical protein